MPSSVLQQLPHHIAVAWSGGLDSTALLLYLRDAGYAVQAWHVDHGWNRGSAHAAKSLQAQAKQWNIPFYCTRLQKPVQNVEAEARKGRYAAFKGFFEQTMCSDLALAHHADDQAETVCMRLLQGSGAAGCQGMKERRVQDGLQLWRPFLHVRQANIESALKKQGVSWQEDPSNADTTFWRNKIRKRLFPTMQVSGVDPHALFMRWQKQAVRVQKLIADQGLSVAIEKHRVEKDEFCVMDWQQWIAQPAPVRAFVLQQMIGRLFEDGRVFGRRHILAIEAWREHGGHSWLNLSRCCLYRQGKGLQLCKGKASLRDCLQHEYDDGQG